MEHTSRWLGDGVFWRAALRLAVPVALQTLLTNSFAMVDTIMIGQLGEVSLAAAGMAGQWSWLMALCLFGISSGASVFLAQYWGAGDGEGIARTYGLALCNTLAIALIFTLVACLAPEWVVGLFSRDAEVIRQGSGYLRIAALSFPFIAMQQICNTVLRSTERVRLPVLTSLVSVGLNTLLNYLLIFGHWGFPRLGMEGAAIATVISAAVNPLLLLGISLVRRNVLIQPLHRLMDISRGFFKDFYRISMPVLFNESLWALGNMGYNMVYGRMGTGNYSALTVFRTVEGMAFIAFTGMCHACAVLVGKQVGAGRLEQARQDALRFGVLVPAMSVLAGVVMILLRGQITGLFNLTPEVRGTAMTLLAIYGVEMPLRVISYICIVGIFRAGGDTRTGMRYDLGSVWLIALPIVLVTGLLLKWPFPVVFLLMYLAEDGVKATFCIRRFRSGKWIMPVTQGRQEKPQALGSSGLAGQEQA